MDLRRTLVAGLLVGGALVGSAGASFAQDSGIESYIELLRSDLKTTKTELVTELLDMPDAKAQTFWPVYKEYQLELDKVGDRRVANIKDYAANFGTMTDAKASELVKNAMDFQTKRLALHKTYVKKFEKVLGAVDTAKLMQLESVIENLVDLQIGAELPLIEKTGGEATTAK